MSRLQRCADAFAIAPHAVQAVALAPMPASPGTRRMNPTVPQRWVHIRNAEGEHVMTTIDGEVVALA